MLNRNCVRVVLTVLLMVAAGSCVPMLVYFLTHAAGNMLPSVLAGVALYFIFLRKRGSAE